MSQSNSPRADYSSVSRSHSRSGSRATTRRAGNRALENIDRLVSPHRQRGAVLDPVDIPAVNNLLLELNELAAAHARLSDRSAGRLEIPRRILRAIA